MAHYRGDFEVAADGVAARRRDGGAARGGAFTCSAALAATYGGDLERGPHGCSTAREELMAPVGSLSQHAYRAYVEGESRAPTSLDDAMPYYREAIDLASRAGTSFVEGVARVSLVSAQRRSGDVAGAAAGYGELLREWRRTGHNPQLWTTARNAAELLASAGHVETAALLLITAEEAPGVAAVGTGDRAVQPAVVRAARRTWSSLPTSRGSGRRPPAMGRPRCSTAPRRSCGRCAERRRHRSTLPRPATADTAGRTPQPHRGTGSLLDDLGSWLGVLQGQPGPPLDVADERRPELRVVRQPGVVRREAHQRCEPEPLIRGDAQSTMVREHRLVAAVLLGVGRRSAEDLDPPVGDVGAVLLVHPAGEERRQQLVLLDPVVERVDQPSERTRATGPLDQGRLDSRLGHVIM